MRLEGIAKGKAEGLAQGKTEGLALGKTEGPAEAVLKLMNARGLLTDDARQRILACRDMDTLDRWLIRAATAQVPSAVFVDD